MTRYEVKDRLLRDWSTWIVRAVLLAGIGYGGWWVRTVNTTLDGLVRDVAYIKGVLSR